MKIKQIKRKSEPFLRIEHQVTNAADMSDIIIQHLAINLVTAVSGKCHQWMLNLLGDAQQDIYMVSSIFPQDIH